MNTMLPIGSVVGLKGEKSKILIIGHLHQQIVGNSLGVSQYSGIEYSFGFRNEGEIYYFDEDMIDNIYFAGFAVDSDRLYLKLLYDLYKAIDNKKDLIEATKSILDKVYKDDDEKKEFILNNIKSYFKTSKGEKNDG